MKQKIILVIALIAFTALGIHTFVQRENKLQFQEIQLKSKQTEIQQLEIDYQVLDKKQKTIKESHDASQAEVEKLQKEKDDLLKRQQELEQQLSLKQQAQQLASQRLNNAATAATGTQVAVAATGCNTGNQYKDYIYMKESGCNPSAVNSIGCRGIGQACPGNKLPCGADFDCQDAWFSNYAIQRYGSWEAAYAFWLNNHWW
jgi:hypothetical protein